MTEPRTVLVVGIGNPDRGDDGVGPAVAREVAAFGLPDVVVVGSADPVDLLDDQLSADLLVVVDAVHGAGGAPGSVVVREIGEEPLPAWSGSGGTHALGLEAAVELARALGRMPRRLVLVGVEASDFAPGAGLSDDVQAAVVVAAHTVAAVTRSVAADGH